MATLRQRLHVKNKSNSFDVIYLESSSDVILHGNRSLEDALICLPKIKTDNTDPTAPIKTGEVLVTPNGTIYIGHDSKISVYDPKQLYIWDKYATSYETRYYWGKYTVNTTSVPVYATEAILIYPNDYFYLNGPSGSIPYCSISSTLSQNYTFDKYTGKFALKSISGYMTLNEIKSAGYYDIQNRVFLIGSYVSGMNSHTVTLISSSQNGSGLLFYDRAVGNTDAKSPNVYTSYRDSYESTASKGSYIETVYSLQPAAYPNNGQSGNYWYTYSHYSQVATGPNGQAIGQVTSPDEYAYPNNGEKDGYWYIRR